MSTQSSRSILYITFEYPVPAQGIQGALGKEPEKIGTCRQTSEENAPHCTDRLMSRSNKKSAFTDPVELVR